MKLVHVCTDVLPETWRQLGSNAKLSGVSLRDFLTYLIVRSRPIPETVSAERALLDRIVRLNRFARKNRSSSLIAEAEERTSCTSSEGNEGTESGDKVPEVRDEEVGPRNKAIDFDELHAEVFGISDSGRERPFPTAYESLQRHIEEMERAASNAQRTIHTVPP